MWLVSEGDVNGVAFLDTVAGWRALADDGAEGDGVGYWLW